MTSPVDTVNIALAEIGTQSTVSSISPSDGSNEGNIASLLYQPKIDSLHRAAHWNFARYQASLTLIRSTIIAGVASSDPPPQPWLYEYLYPADCLQARFIIPYMNPTAGVSPPLTTAMNQAPILFAGPPIKFQVANDLYLNKPTRVIFTNAENAILVYTKRIVNPDLWDAHFSNAATSFLGAWFVNALTRDRSLMKDQFEIAKDIINQARISDGNEGLTNADSLPDWMAVRGVSGDLIGGGIYYQSWSSIGFPGGWSV